jgi:hypothetical protein
MVITRIYPINLKMHVLSIDKSPASRFCSVARTRPFLLRKNTRQEISLRPNSQIIPYFKALLPMLAKRNFELSCDRRQVIVILLRGLRSLLSP